MLGLSILKLKVIIIGLYKSTRDSFDITNARVGELENK